MGGGEGSGVSVNDCRYKEAGDQIDTSARWLLLPCSVDDGTLPQNMNSWQKQPGMRCPHHHAVDLLAHCLCSCRPCPCLQC